MLKKRKIFKCKDISLDYTNKTLTMGILNITPDSFSDGGKNFSVESAIENAKNMIKCGVDIIDVGGQSTRPNHIEISDDEEFSRVEPVLKELLKITDKPISIDTYYPKVALECAKIGCHIINDVTGFDNIEVAKIVAQYNLGCIIMHHTPYVSSQEMKEFFANRLSLCQSLSIAKENICFDCGIGFNKDVEQNLRCINEFDKYIVDNCCMMIAGSRKRVIGAVTNEEVASNRDIATFSAHNVAILKGANIVRVHNVCDSIKSTKMIDAIIHA